jgi:hypothetical protein
VAQRVEVGPELHRGRDLLGDPVDVVVTDAALLVGVVSRRDERLAEEAAREDRNVFIEHAAEVVQLSLAHRRQRRPPLGVGDVVEHPVLIVGTELRRPPALVAAPAGLCLACHGHC